MSRATLLLVIGTSAIASCFPPGASGPGFRMAPESIRGPHWSDLESQLHGTLTVVDEFHGTRVYVAHLPEGRITETYLPSVDALDACSIPGGNDAYALLDDGRIVHAAQGLEFKPIFKTKDAVEPGSSIALSPDGSTIALLHQLASDDWSHPNPYRLTLVDVTTGRTLDLPGEFNGYRPCWAPDGKSIYATESHGRIVQCSLVPSDADHCVGEGRAPLLSENEMWLMFAPNSRPAREWTGVAWRISSTLMRWTIGTTEGPETLPVQVHGVGQVIAVSATGLIVVESEPDERLPLEHSGFFMRGPYWRGGISVFDPSTGATEPLFVGIAPNSIQWRWD